MIWNESIECASRDELRRIQSQRLVDTVQRVYQAVPSYRHKMQEAGLVPADIPFQVSDECREISQFLYGKLNCKGVVRFDYIFREGTFFFLEVNTVPGLSEQSIIPKMTRAFGWTVTELFTRMIEECIQ